MPKPPPDQGDRPSVVASRNWLLATSVNSNAGNQ